MTDEELDELLEKRDAPLFYFCKYVFTAEILLCFLDTAEQFIIDEVPSAKESEVREAFKRIKRNVVKKAKGDLDNRNQKVIMEANRGKYR